MFDIGPELRQRLGKHGVRRVLAGSQEYDSMCSPRRSNREKRVANPVQEYMQGRAPSDVRCPVSDVITGIARLDWYRGGDRSIPLSVNSIYLLLQVLDVLSTRNVAVALDVGERQAQRYLHACLLAAKFIRSIEEQDWLDAPDPSDSL